MFAFISIGLRNREVKSMSKYLPKEGFILVGEASNKGTWGFKAADKDICYIIRLPDNPEYIKTSVIFGSNTRRPFNQYDTRGIRADMIEVVLQNQGFNYTNAAWSTLPITEATEELIKLVFNL